MAETADSQVSSKTSIEKTVQVDDRPKTLSEFNLAVDMALMHGEEWVETTDEVVKSFLPKGLGDILYFCYRGVKVCVGDPGNPGECSAKLQDKLDVQMGAVIHGEGEGKILGL